MHVKRSNIRDKEESIHQRQENLYPCFEEGLEHARNNSSRTKRTGTPGINAQGKKGSKTTEELKSDQRSEKEGMSEFLLFHALLANQHCCIAKCFFSRGDKSRPMSPLKTPNTIAKRMRIRMKSLERKKE